MKSTKIGIVLFVLVLVGIGFFAHLSSRQEEKKKMKEVLGKGSYLVSLLSMHSLMDFQGDRRDFLLRTLAEYTSYEALGYFFVQDLDGAFLVSLAPGEISSEIPQEVGTKSFYTMGLIEQSFSRKGAQDKIYEFAKPIFENGQKTGVVRLGMKAPSVPLFSLERISLLALIAFIVFAAITFGYYGIILSLRPIRTLNQDMVQTYLNQNMFYEQNMKSNNIGTIMENLDKFLKHIKDKIIRIESDNTELISRLGLITFEKNQIINILDSINFGVVITDTQDNVGHVNGYLLRLLGKEKRDLIDRPLTEVLPYDDILAFLSQPQTAGAETSSRQMESMLPDVAPGDVYQCSYSYLADSDGVPLGKMILLKKVTADKLAEKAREEFVAHIAHELLTPLTNIKSYSEMLMDGEVDDSEMQKEFFNTINDETNRLTSLIRNLLNLSKMEMGNLTLNRGLVRTDWFVEDCIGAIEASARDKNITISTRLPDNYPSLLADKELLKVALINILGNALKYTPENGSITFSLSEEDNAVIFEVTDTGYGISEQDLPHIFDKFYRSTNAQITAQVGSGLGLAITSEIVQLHDGEIEVQSTLGQGTHFTIRLPKEEFSIAGA